MPPRQPRIRPAVRGDLDALVQLEDASFSSDRLSRARYRHHLSSPSACLLVAADETVRASLLLLFRRNSRSARVYSLAVAPAWRRHGLAARLLDAAAAAALARSCERLRLEVRADNAAAQGLYLRCGFAPRGRRPGFYADGSAALLLEKHLQPPDAARADAGSTVA